MTQDDDPEARIRDLERSLEDQASTSEMGDAQSGYAYPPAPPPDFNSYGFPQAGPPRGQGGISPKVVLPVAAALFGVLAIVMAAVTILSARESSSVSPTFSAPSPEFSIPADPSTHSNHSTPSKPGASSAPSIESQAPPPGPPPGGSLVIRKSGTYACNDSVVAVPGDSINVVITGHCAKLIVHGEDIKVTVDASDTIIVTGVNSEVVYHSGTPSKVATSGGNVIRQG